MLASLLFLLSGAAMAAEPETKPLYAVPEVGHGAAQSPINILSTQTDRHRHRLGLDGIPRNGRVISEPHTLRVHAEDQVSVRLDGEAYMLLQCHYHTPSEHLIDGVTYPAEKHCVSEDSENGDYLVVATLYKMGASDPMLGAALDAARDDGVLAGTALISESTMRSHHFVYHGSLTTPPFSENVSWVVSSRIETASQTQIERLNALEGDNARHVQQLAGRTIDID